MEKGGDCTNGACYWFSNNVEIPGAPTLPHSARSVQLNVTGGERDVYKTSPWRAPGTAPVYGSGCGSAGGGPVAYLNGGWAPKGQGVKQGDDGLELPAHGDPAVWPRGSEQEVGWAISANHGGGYSYRLCPSDGNVTEECFQRTQLKFAGETSWIAFPNGTRFAFPITKVTNGTFPIGSEWARDPIPGCYMCDAYTTCGAPMTPVPGFMPTKWNDQVDCYAACDGTSVPKTTGGACPEGTPQFPPPAPEFSGFGKSVWEWSVIDKVVVPKDLKPGAYLLSWRWDCEESTQVWQNCADIVIQ